jgi:fluoroquinolone resistance protein
MDSQLHQHKTFENIDYSETKLSNLEFLNCEFLNCNFSKTDLSYNDFLECTFKNCNFSLAILKNTFSPQIYIIFLDNRDNI